MEGVKLEVKDQTIAEFLNNLSAKSPTPGGGCASALAGAMAASLVSMYCEFTLGKKKYKDVEQEIQSAHELAQNKYRELLDLCQKDIDAFNMVVASRKDQEKYQLAIKEATKVPLRIAEISLDIYLTASEICFLGNQNLRSDIQVAIFLARASILGALANVTVNLDEILDEQFRKEIYEKVNFILSLINQD